MYAPDDYPIDYNWQPADYVGSLVVEKDGKLGVAIGVTPDLQLMVFDLVSVRYISQWRLYHVELVIF